MIYYFDNLINFFFFFIISYLAKCIKHETITVNIQQTVTELQEFKTLISNVIMADAQKKLLEMEVINYQITTIEDSIEHYILICDVLWCLMRTSCSMANLKCELVLYCNNVFKITFDDIVHFQVCIFLV